MSKIRSNEPLLRLMSMQVNSTTVLMILMILALKIF